MDSKTASTSLDKILTADTLEEGDKLVQKAFELVGQKQWAQALQVCNEALASAIDSLSPPFEALALNLRGTFSFLTGKIEDAMVDMEKSYEIDSHNVDTIVKRATLYMEKAEVEKAVRIFEEAEKENPDHPDLYYHRGVLYCPS